MKMRMRQWDGLQIKKVRTVQPAVFFAPFIESHIEKVCNNRTENKEEQLTHIRLLVINSSIFWRFVKEKMTIHQRSL